MADRIPENRAQLGPDTCLAYHSQMCFLSADNPSQFLHAEMQFRSQKRPLFVSHFKFPGIFRQTQTTPKKRPLTVFEPFCTIKREATSLPVWRPNEWAQLQDLTCYRVFRFRKATMTTVALLWFGLDWMKKRFVCLKQFMPMFRMCLAFDTNLSLSSLGSF